MKTLFTRAIPLLLCIGIGKAVSWVAIYAFWFGVWAFHSVPAARFCDAVGQFLLIPGRFIFEHMGADQSPLFFDPKSFSGANGLILGLIFYWIFRVLWSRREAAQARAKLAGEARPAEVRTA